MKTPEEWASLLYINCSCKQGNVQMEVCPHRRDSALIIQDAMVDAMRVCAQVCDQVNRTACGHTRGHTANEIACKIRDMIKEMPHGY